MAPSHSGGYGHDDVRQTQTIGCTPTRGRPGRYTTPLTLTLTLTRHTLRRLVCQQCSILLSLLVWLFRRSFTHTSTEERVRVAQPWRDDLSKLHKLRVALDSHLPGGWASPQRSAFVKGFLRKLQSVWYPAGLPGYPAAAGALLSCDD